MAVEHGVADGIDAAVEPVQPAARHAPLDRAASESDLVELANAHHTVLSRGEIGESKVWGCLYTHTVYEQPHPKSRPPSNPPSMPGFGPPRLISTA